MEPWQEELADLKAHLAVQHMALCALARSHPDPAAALEAWRQLRADKVVAAYASSHDHARDWLTARVLALAEEWTSELANAAARDVTRDGSAAA
ncbi:MAG: hypothetical protein ACTHKZ_10240 [Lysobacteraceae bacterium]